MAAAALTPAGRALALGAALIGAGCYRPRTADPQALLEALRGTDRNASQTQPGSDGKLAITEHRAVALALLRNPSLQAFRLERGVAEGEVQAAGALSNPELRLELRHLQASRVGWGIGLAWEPPQPVVRSAKKAAARAHRDEVEHAIRDREWALATQVRDAYAALEHADQTARLTSDAVAVRGKLRTAVEGRLSHGGATRFDLDLAALGIADADRLAAEAKLARRHAERMLASLLGLSPDLNMSVPIEDAVVGAVPATPPLACAGLEDRAVASRPSVAAAAAHQIARGQQARLEHAARWPWFRFFALPRVRRNEFFGNGNETDYVLGIELKLPLLDWNTGRIRAAEAAEERAQAELVAVVDGVRREVASACADLSAQQELLRSQQERLLPVLTEHDRLMAQALRAHEVDLTAMILTEGRVLDVRLGLARTRLAVRRAQIAVERALGSRLEHAASVSGNPPR